MGDKGHDEIRDAVRKSYAEIAKAGVSGCGCSTASSCCGSAPASGPQSSEEASARMGYTDKELAQVPEGSNMGLGCGNPQAIASLKPGEGVRDLGSGGGFDCFLAATAVGEEGRVIGVDMTPEMIATARENARKGGFANVEFRLGEIEHLPVADATVDVLISNCVVNLSPDKEAVFREAFRILKPGGRIAFSDIVATSPMPAELKSDVAMISKCITGAEMIEDIERWLTEAGFEGIAVTPAEESREFISEWAPGLGVEKYIVSATIEAVRPAAT